MVPPSNTNTESHLFSSFADFFCFVPPEELKQDDIDPLTLTLADLKTGQDKKSSFDKVAQFPSFKRAIITRDLFSFFRYNDNQAYLIVIDKRSPSSSIDQSSSFIRYTFSGMLDEYEVGQLVLSTSNSHYGENEKIDLSNVQVEIGEAFMFSLGDLPSNYIDALHWWKKGVIYEIVVSSFQDSNGDGFGDINGLRQRLNYIQELGIKTIWLTPIYKTPFRDLGYDISDFCDIDPRFGTLDEFRSLVADIHSRQMRLILDFVPNHCAAEHPWFQAALRNEQPYVDYFVWHPGKNNDSSEPPTNWVGYAGQSMWTWSSARKMWYLHQFMDGQPDFNFRNENVHREIERILTFWLDLGVDGFRADATRHLVENDDYKDEPLKPDSDADPEVEYDAYDHTETANHPDNCKIIMRWRRFLDEYTRKNKRDYILIMTETQDKNVEANMPYYGLNRWSRGNDIAINFFIAYFFGEEPEDRTAEGLAEFTELWTSNVPAEAWSSWILSSHDSKRTATKLAMSELVDGFYMIFLLLPGTAIAYYGEEIAMENRQFTAANRDEIVDLSAFNYGMKDPSKIEKKIRDGERTPMQWTSTQPNAGFTSASKPYLPLADTWKTINVQSEQSAARSHLKVFQQLVQLRQNPPFYGGKHKLVRASKDIYAFIRWSTKPASIAAHLVVLNMAGAGRKIEQKEKPITVDFIPLLKCKINNAKGKVVVRSCNITNDSPLAKEGNQIDLNDVSLRANEAVVLELMIPVDQIGLCAS